MTPSNPPRNLPVWIYGTIVLFLIGVTAAILLSMGRSLGYASGSIKLWYGNAWGPENSQQFADPYTFTHLIHGVLFYLLLRIVAPRWSVATRGVVAIALECAWEILENSDMVINRYRATTMALGYYGDSVLNSVGDIMACAVGFVLAARLPTSITIVGAIGVEALLLLLIRDSLLLNIVMLIYPIEAVKTWQLGH